MTRTWQDVMREHAAVVDGLREAGAVLDGIALTIVAAVRAGGKVVVLGNGGSAADAQHIAAELVGRFRRERAAIPALALTTDTSGLTAIGNDYGFERVFARQVEALVAAGDVVWCLSTSGSSANVLAAAAAARERGATVVGFTGGWGGKLAGFCTHVFRVPHDASDRIQEGHVLAYHYVCERVEGELAGER